MGTANGNGDFGIFDDEGQIEGGFGSESAAERALLADYAEDDAHVAECCSEHPEHEAESCEECAGTDEDMTGISDADVRDHDATLDATLP